LSLQYIITETKLQKKLEKKYAFSTLLSEKKRQCWEEKGKKWSISSNLHVILCGLWLSPQNEKTVLL
jgi:hypothetical protein